MAWWANSEQNDYMEDLRKTPAEELCWCGWNAFGDCGNEHCFPDKTAADKIAVRCEECHNHPHPGIPEISHIVTCSKRRK